MDEPVHAEPTELELRIGHIRIGLRPGQSLVLGSSEGCDVRLAHGAVSARHALLRVQEDGGVLLDDLDSEAGTRVDGRRVQQFDLRPGDVAVLGRVEVELLAVKPRPVTAPVSESGAKISMRNLPIRMHEEASFRDLMAEELRRTPWFAISVAIHLLLLLLFYEMLRPEPVGSSRSIAITSGDDRGDLSSDMFASREEPIELEEPDPLMEIDAELDRHDEELQESMRERSIVTWPREGGLEADRQLLTKVAKRSSVAGDILNTGGSGLDSAGFRETVTELRESSLEIVFVFDSTGSMGPVLDVTKARIARMLEVLQALVPDARVGIVTFRDRNEDYLTRSIPLGQDFYRAINFMQVIHADGGGGRPEDVRAGLKEAFSQRWRPDARRVVVLIGDAPPHDNSMRGISQDTRAFARQGTSYVHGIVTGSQRGRPVKQDTMESFQKIAKAGNGQCLSFEDEETLLLQVLSLAFGEEYRRNLEEVYRIVDSRGSQVSASDLMAMRDPDGAMLRRRLAATPVPDGFVRAMLQQPSEELALQLVDILSRSRYPEPGRQAASYALQQMLGLRAPPLDPEEGGRLRARDARNLSELVRNRLSRADERESR